MTAVPSGEYTVEVDLAGFRPVHLVTTVTSDAARVVHVSLEVGAVSAAVHVSADPASAGPLRAAATVVTGGDVAGTPGASQTNSLSMITAFVPGSYVAHDQLHVRGGHQVTWLVDGVPVPNTNIGSNIGPQVNPKDVDYVEVVRGGYNAEYGDRTYAVFDVVPRTGFERDGDVELLLSGGAFGQTNDQVSAGGHSQRLAYYGSLTGDRSDLGLEPPVASVLHDRESGLGAFGTFLFGPDPNNELRIVTSVRRDSYQVPNDASAQAVGVDDVEREADAFVNASWVWAFRSGALLTVSPFYHRNAAHYDGGPADLPASTTDHRLSQDVGAQVTFGATTGRHEYQVGFYGFHQRDDQSLGLVFPDGSSPSLSVRQHPSGGLWSAFVQDTFRAATWLSVSGGLRQTHFAGGVSEDATSPRASVVVEVPSLGWSLRGFWGRYYQGPPLATASGPLLDLVTSQNLSLIPLHGERDNEVQFSVVVPVQGWTVDADVFRTTATNFFDHNSVGNSNVYLPVTIGGARIRGAEVTARSPRSWKGGHLHVAYSRQIAEGYGGISGGLTDFSPGTGAFPLDHDQRHTLSAGVDTHLPQGVFAGANLSYGSGFPDNGGPARLPGHTTVDLMIGRSMGQRLSVSVTALNLANVRVLIDNSPTFGGTHFSLPRQIYAELRYRFRY